MKQSTFQKELSATGSQGTVNAKIVATMNYKTVVVNMHNPSTHEDSIANKPVHKLVATVGGVVWLEVDEIESENMLLNESENMIKQVQDFINRKANEVPVKSFTDKMIELFK
jgi:hypothetical protein